MAAMLAIQMPIMMRENRPSQIPERPSFLFLQDTLPNMSDNMPHMNPIGAVTSSAFNEHATMPRMRLDLANPFNDITFLHQFPYASRMYFSISSPKNKKNASARMMTQGSMYPGSYIRLTSNWKAVHSHKTIALFSCYGYDCK